MYKDLTKEKNVLSKCYSLLDMPVIAECIKNEQSPQLLDGYTSVAFYLAKREKNIKALDTLLRGGF